MRKLYWDTGIFLCFLHADEGSRRRICEDIFQNAKAGSVTLYTSTYAIVETVRPKRFDATRLTPQEIATIQKMFQWSWLKKIDVDQRVAFKAVELSRDRGLKPADAVHAASAILSRVDALQCWDGDFSVVADLIGVEEPAFMTPQLSMIEPARIGPAPEDFRKPIK